MNARVQKVLPSSRWSSADNWDYNGMKERIEGLLSRLDKSALVRHAESLLGQRFKLSTPFSAGQYWVCFELVGQDSGLLVIARVRLPRHPQILEAVTEQDELESIKCEVETMGFVKAQVPQLGVPTVHAFAGPATKEAEEAGAMYMLIEGFYGNTLQDVAFDFTQLGVETQDHIITQWTAAQVALASLTFPVIGSIRSTSATGDPELGSLSCAAIEGLESRGPFSSASDYFKTLGKARYENACRGGEGVRTKLSLLTFLDIVEKTSLFASIPGEHFSLNHMDMGTQNILVDDDFNFLAIIDWEFAQTAPWQVNHFPMPFPLTSSDEELEHILQDQNHIAHDNVLRQAAAREMYVQKMMQAEEDAARRSRLLERPISSMLNGPACRIYACLERVNGDDDNDEALACEMVRLAYGLELEAAQQYICNLNDKMATR